jgi:phospholipid/cholesterol/gamma-HCH transport system permease protein
MPDTIAPSPEHLPVQAPSMFQEFIRRIGHQTVASLKFAGGFGNLTLLILRQMIRGPFYFHLTMEQLFHMGIRSFSLVVVTGLATGSVMALQFGYGLQKFGGTLYVPKIVAITVLREMGPVFTSLLLAGRIGSGIASEVASMKVTQQIDAIRALGTSPINRIVIPRLVAALIALPILTLFADYIALFGAMLVAKHELNINVEFFWAKVLESITIGDLWSGMLKTMVFAFFIAITACWKGLKTDRGTAGVGNTTTWVVVTSSIFIMISDFFLTKIFILLVYKN